MRHKCRLERIGLGDGKDGDRDIDNYLPKPQLQFQNLTQENIENIEDILSNEEILGRIGF